MIVSIKEHNPKDMRWRQQFSSDGFTATGSTLKMLIQEAYGLSGNTPMKGLEGWPSSVRFDIQAKVEGDAVEQFQQLSGAERRILLQVLLSDRFRLIVKRVPTEERIYGLKLAKAGPLFKETPVDEVPEHVRVDGGGTVLSSTPGALEVRWVTLESFASILSLETARYIVDQTGLKGRYNISLEWDPGLQEESLANGSLISQTSKPALVTALKEQLGLILEPLKGIVNVVVVEQETMPALDN